MKKVKEFLKCLNIQNALAALVLLAVGIILVAFADDILHVICYIGGVLMIVLSVIRLVTIIRTRQKDVCDITLALIMLITGSLLIATPSVAISWFVSFVFGFILIVDGIIRVQDAVMMYGQKEKRWWAHLAVAAVCVISGVVIIVNPFGTQRVMYTMIGISLIVDALFALAGIAYDAAKEFKSDRVE